jgi:hypothetical protein
LFLRAAVVMAVLAGNRASSAQDIQHRLPAFQAPASDSLESEMLSRVSLTGQFQPDDLPRVARLAVLNSISMLVNVRADLPDSVLGNQIDQEITGLWNSSQAFYEVVSTPPSDAASVARAQFLLAEVDAGYRRLASSLGELPGVSDRAADNLRSFSRLLGPVNSLMGTLEADVASQAQPTPERPLSLDSLRREAQIVANLLVPLIGKAGDVGRGRPGRDALITDLTDLLDRLQGFCRLLSIEPPLAEIQGSFRDARRQMWRTESRLLHVEWRASLEPPWRDVRQRMNALSDALGLPRVIVAAPVARPISAADRSVAAHVDHAVAWLDEFLYENAAKLRKTATGTQLKTDATALRHELLELRRRAIGGEPAERLTRSIQNIERLNQGLSDRAAELARDSASQSHAALYKNTAQAVRQLGTAVAKR